MIFDAGAAQRLEECGLGFEEMDVGIPQRVVSIEDQVEAAGTRIRNHQKERSRAGYCGQSCRQRCENVRSGRNVKRGRNSSVTLRSEKFHHDERYGPRLVPRNEFLRR